MVDEHRSYAINVGWGTECKRMKSVVEEMSEEEKGEEDVGRGRNMREDRRQHGDSTEKSPPKGMMAVEGTRQRI